MSDKLPKGWVKTKLGEICLPVATVQPAATPNAEFTYFDIGGIDNESNRIAETKTVTGREAPSRARQVARTGDILFSTVRTYLKKIARIEHEYPNPVASTGFTVIRAAEGVSSQFLFYRVLSEEFLQPLHALQTGSSYPAVRDKDVFAQLIPLPPSREQERIAAKLDALLARIAAGEAAARRAQERLKRYRAAVLHAAVTGELTRDWRKTHKPSETGAQLLKRLLQERRARWEEAELKRLHATGKPPKDDKWKTRYSAPIPPRASDLPGLPKGWVWASIEQASCRVTVGHVGSMKNEYVSSGIPFLRSQNIRANRFDPEGLLYISPQFHATLSKSKTFPGDVAVVRSGNVGTTCVIPESLGEANCSDLVLIQRPLVEPHLIAFYMNSAAQKHVEAGKVGVALTHFNTASVAALSISIPPPKEQAELIRQTERRLSAIERLTVTLTKQLARARALRQSLLREAFTGTLVPQNSNDESASALLDRIRAARKVQAEKPRPKRMPKTKKQLKDVKRRNLVEVLKENGAPMTPEEIFTRAGYGEAIEPAEVADPTKAVEAFYAEVSRLTGESLLAEKRSPYDRGLVQLEARK